MFEKQVIETPASGFIYFLLGVSALLVVWSMNKLGLLEKGAVDKLAVAEFMLDGEGANMDVGPGEACIRIAEEGAVEALDRFPGRKMMPRTVEMDQGMGIFLNRFRATLISCWLVSCDFF